MCAVSFSECAEKTAQNHGTALARAYTANGTVPCRCAVPFTLPTVPVQIHGVSCQLSQESADWAVWARGLVVARVGQRLMAVAAAARVLAPARAVPGA